jgi:hypothetical protein
MDPPRYESVPRLFRGLPGAADRGGEQGFGLVLTVGQLLAMFDFVAVGGSWQGRHLEYADHLHEQFADPVVIKNEVTSPR